MGRNPTFQDDGTPIIDFSNNLAMRSSLDGMKLRNPGWRYCELLRVKERIPGYAQGRGS